MAMEDSDNSFSKMRNRAARNAVRPSERRTSEDQTRLAGIVRRARGTKADEMAPGVQAEAQKRFTAEQARTAGMEDFSDMADINVEAEADEMDPIKIEGVAPTKVEVTNVDSDKAMAQSAPAAKTFGTQYKATEGGKVRFSPKGDLYVYEYDPSTKTYTIVDHPQGKGVGATFGADHPSIAKFDESRMAAQQESGAAEEAPAAEAPAAGGPDESVFAPPGARSEMPMADQVPGETIRAEDPGMRTMRAQEAGRTEEDVTEAQRASLQATAYSETLTDEQKAERLNAEGVFYSPANSLEIFDAIYKGPQPIVRDGVLNNNNVLNAIATGKLSPEDWPLIKRQLERFGDFKTEVGADPTKDPRLLAKIAARRAMSDQ